MPPASSNTTTPSVIQPTVWRSSASTSSLRRSPPRASGRSTPRARNSAPESSSRRHSTPVPSFNSALRISAAPCEKSSPPDCSQRFTRSHSRGRKNSTKREACLPVRAAGADPSWERIFRAARLIPFTKPPRSTSTTGCPLDSSSAMRHISVRARSDQRAFCCNTWVAAARAASARCSRRSRLSRLVRLRGRPASRTPCAEPS